MCDVRHGLTGHQVSKYLTLLYLFYLTRNRDMSIFDDLLFLNVICNLPSFKLESI